MNNLSSRVCQSVAPAMEALEGRTFLSGPAPGSPGSLDPTFGQNGAVYLTAQRPVDVQTVAAAALPGGKTLLLGSMDVYLGNNYPSPTFSLARLNADGSPDETFGAGGVRIVQGTDSFPPSPQKGVLNGIIFHPYTMAVDDRGRIYVAGEDLSNQAAIARLNPDGSPDDTFGDHGFVNPILSEVNAIAFALDGTIFVGGYVVQPSNAGFYGGPHDFAVARLRDNGTPEDSFGDHGMAVAKFQGRTRRRNSAVHALWIDSRGRILAAGGEDGVFDLARFGVNGFVDQSFGSGGEAAIVGDGRPNSADGVDIPGGPFFDALTVRHQDGEIFAAGGSPRAIDYGAQGGPLIVAAFNPNGRLDPRFGQGGTVQVPVGEADGSARQAQANGIALVPSGRILLSGTFGVTAEYGEHEQGILLERLNADGSPDTSFGTMFASAPGSDPAAALRFLPTAHRGDFTGEVTWDRLAAGLLPAADGKFIVPLNGSFGDSLYEQLNCLRFNVDGSLDRSFGYKGVASVTWSQPDQAQPARLASGPAGSGVYVTVRRDREGFVAGLAADGRTNAAFRFDRLLDFTNTPEISVVAVQSDHKVLVEDRHPETSVDLVRYNPDGSIDLSWGVNGRVRFNDGSGEFYVRKVLPRADGSVLVDIFLWSGGMYGSYADTLYLLDPSGRVAATYHFPQWNNYFGLHSVFTDMDLAPDGKVVVSTLPTRFYHPASSLALVRLNADDLTPDVTFGNGGTANVPLAPTSDGWVGNPGGGLSGGDAVVLLHDGSALVSGTERDSHSGNNIGALVRISPSGAVDPTFGQSGILRVPAAVGWFTSGEAATIGIKPGDMLVQRDGKFLIVTRDSRLVVWIARFNPDGSPDLTFGQGGAAIMPRGASFFALTQTASGEKLLVAGYVKPRRRSDYDVYGTESATFIERFNL